MTMELAGKTVLVTGGSRGMGQRLALRLGREDANVVVNYRRDLEAATATVQGVKDGGGNAVAVQADIARTEDVEQLVASSVEAFGGLDVVVANAAASAFKPLTDIRAHHVEKTMSLTVTGFLDLVRFAAPHLGQGGRVLAVSGWDSFRALPGHGLLGAAKAAMESLVRYFAVELGPQGITAVGVCPGFIDTDSSRFYAGEHWEDYERNWLAMTPSGAYPTADDVAEVMAFLCSPRSASINGQTIVLDGGLSVATMPRSFGA